MKTLSKQQHARRIELIKLYIANEIKFIKGGYIKPYVQIETYVEYMEITGQDMREDIIYQSIWQWESLNIQSKSKKLASC